jgi:hypothetical protein
MRGRRSVLILGFVVTLADLGAAQSAPPGRFFSLSAGMGINAHSAPSTADYISTVLQLHEPNKIGDFTSAIEFFVTPELQVSDDLSLALEYSYLVKSYNLSSTAGPGISEFSTSIHMPTAVVHYLIPGQGYWLKLGGGVGYYFGSFSQMLYGSGQIETFRASAPGVKLEAVGNTMFDESFYGYIGIDVRWGFDEPFARDDGSVPSYQGAAPSLGFFNLGLKLGVAMFW